MDLPRLLGNPMGSHTGPWASFACPQLAQPQQQQGNLFLTEKSRGRLANLNFS